MAIKQLQKTVKKPVVVNKMVDKVEKFISKGGTLAANIEEAHDDHRLTLRIPCWLMNKIDAKRKERVGTISRNLFILEVLDKATKE
jgi:hypothetical protein